MSDNDHQTPDENAPHGANTEAEMDADDADYDATS